MNIPNTMKMNAATSLVRDIALRGSRRRDDEIGSRRRPAGPYRGGRAGHGLTAAARRGFEPERAEQGRLRRVAGSRVWTVATTERPGPQRDLPSARLRGSAMRTATRCTTLVKLPVALSGGSSENCAPEAGETDDTTPSTTLPSSASTATSTFWPGRMLRELRLLEIGVDIGRVERHQRHQPRARLHELADLGRLVADDVPSKGATTRVKERSRSAWPGRSRVRCAGASASSFCALSTSRLAFAPSSAAAAEAGSPWRRPRRRWCGRGRRSPVRDAAASRNWSGRA